LRQDVTEECALIVSGRGNRIRKREIARWAEIA
jgi:hypothetical protein